MSPTREAASFALGIFRRPGRALRTRNAKWGSAWLIDIVVPLQKIRTHHSSAVPMVTCPLPQGTRPRARARAARQGDPQLRAVGLVGTAIVASFVSIETVLGRLYYDALKSDSQLAGMIALSVVGGLLGCCTCCGSRAKWCASVAARGVRGHGQLSV